MIFKVLRGFLVVLFVAACAQTDNGGSIQGGSVSGSGGESAEASSPEASSTEASENQMTEATEGEMAAKVETEETMAAAEPAAPADNFTVLFDLDSWILSREAEATIDDAVAAAALLGRQSFSIDGYADGTGGRRTNARMSRLRAEAIADELIMRGVTSERIQLTAHGSANPAVGSAGGSPEQANRRATITLK